MGYSWFITMNMMPDKIIIYNICLDKFMINISLLLMQINLPTVLPYNAEVD